MMSHAMTAGHPDVDRIQDVEIVPLERAVAGSNVTIAVGEPELRRLLCIRAEERGLKLSSIFSPRAFISESANIHDGAIVAPFVSVQSEALIERNVSVNTQAIIGHHVRVEEGSVISSQVNLGGASSVGKFSYIGMGALILQGIKIGANSIVGLGSVVYKEIPDQVIALGNPARVARKNVDKQVFK